MTRSCLRKAVSRQQRSLLCQSAMMSFILQKIWGHSIQSGKKFLCILIKFYWRLIQFRLLTRLPIDSSTSMHLKREINYFETMHTILSRETCQSKVSNIILFSSTGLLKSMDNFVLRRLDSCFCNINHTCSDIFHHTIIQLKNCFEISSGNFFWGEGWPHNFSTYILNHILVVILETFGNTEWLEVNQHRASASIEIHCDVWEWGRNRFSSVTKD